MMTTLIEREFWFVVGSQQLYGEEALQEVKANAQKITDALNESGVLPYPIKLQELAVNTEKITNIMKEVNYRDEVAGVITWMHTFSPAKMWIRGKKLLQKPLLHLATKFHKSITCETFTQDFMILSYYAHRSEE